jgi:hypothetical protein
VIPAPSTNEEPTLYWWWDEPSPRCEQCEFMVDWMVMQEGGQTVECECGETIWES